MSKLSMAGPFPIWENIVVHLPPSEKRPAALSLLQPYIDIRRNDQNYWPMKEDCWTHKLREVQFRIFGRNRQSTQFWERQTPTVCMCLGWVPVSAQRGLLAWSPVVVDADDPPGCSLHRTPAALFWWIVLQISNLNHPTQNSNFKLSCSWSSG